MNGYPTAPAARHCPSSNEPWSSAAPSSAPPDSEILLPLQRHQQQQQREQTLSTKRPLSEPSSEGEDPAAGRGGGAFGFDRSFKRLRIDGSFTTTATATSASSSCGSISPPLHPASLAAAAAASGSQSQQVRQVAGPAPEGLERSQYLGPGVQQQQQQLGATPSDAGFRPLRSDVDDRCSSLARYVSSDSSTSLAYHRHQRQQQQQNLVARGWVRHGNDPLLINGIVQDYTGVNHLLGDLHVLRRRRAEQAQGRGQGQTQQQERGTGQPFGQGVSEGAVLRAHAVGVARAGGLPASTLTPAPMPAPMPGLGRTTQQQQQPQIPHQQQLLKWRRSVRLPTNSQLY